MIDLVEAILCSQCSNFNDCTKNKVECLGNLSGDVWASDIYRGISVWLSSFDTSSATKCFEAVNLLKQKLEGENGR